MPAYYYSPWKEGRTKEEQELLLGAEEMEIADGVEEIGNYTFYGCGNLRRLSFTDSLKRIGGGSFTGCSALRELQVLMVKGAKSCITDVVAETFHEVFVVITFRGTKDSARLVFPEYYEEGVENTPARIRRHIFMVPDTATASVLQKNVWIITAMTVCLRWQRYMKNLRS